MAAVILCFVLMSALMLIDIPILQDIFNPTAPTMNER
jgi:hypothetical protein